MVKHIIQLEKDMWEAVLHQDTERFQKLVLPEKGICAVFCPFLISVSKPTYTTLNTG